MISKTHENTARNFLKEYNFINIVLVITVLTMVCIVYYYNTRDIELKIAYGGFGPQDYVSQKLHPGNYQKDWQNGILVYDNSLPMKVYYWFAKYFDISPTKTIYPFMFVQTLLFVMSVAFLVQTLFGNKFVTFISVTVVLLSPLAGSNLSRFGDGFGSYLKYPLYYGYANAFRFFALTFFFRNKFTPCFVFLALSIYCHVNMGLFALAFIGFYVLYKPKIIREKDFLIGIFIFSVLAIPYIFSIISNAAMTTGGIPADQWITSAKMFSFHWYPITMKMFTKYAHREFFSFLLLGFFFLVALRYHNIKNEKTKKIIMGSIGCLIMSIIGIIVSDVFPIPFLIKISLQRSTGLITFLGVLYLIYYLFMKAKTGNIFIAFLAIYSLLILVFAKPGIAVLPLFLLLHSDIRDGHIGPIKLHHDKIKTIKIFYYAAAIFLLFVVFMSLIKSSGQFPIVKYVYEQLWTPLQYFNPYELFDFSLRGGRFKVDNFFIYLVVLSVLIAGAIVVIKSVKKRCLTTLGLIFLFVILVSAVWYLERVKYLKWHNHYAETASSYLDVQLWAKGNTPYDALFMPDPSHGYGWRDFSERSSFGSLREWGFTSILYNPKYKTYLEGIKRMKEFGIDINEITNEDLRDSKFRIYGRKLARDIRSVYYSMKTDKLKELSGKYGIDYIVMNKKFHKNKFVAFDVAYENKYYIVYKF